MKSIDDALELRGRILGAFEQAERSSDPVRRVEAVDVRGRGCRARPASRWRARSRSWPTRRSRAASATSIQPRRTSSCWMPRRPSCRRWARNLVSRRRSPAGEDGRRDPAQRHGHRRRPQRNHGEGSRRHASDASNRPASYGRPACQASPLGRDLAEAVRVSRLDRAGRVKVNFRTCPIPGSPERLRRR